MGAAPKGEGEASFLVLAAPKLKPVDADDAPKPPVEAPPPGEATEKLNPPPLGLGTSTSSPPPSSIPLSPSSSSIAGGACTAGVVVDAPNPPNDGAGLGAAPNPAPPKGDVVAGAAGAGVAEKEKGEAAFSGGGDLAAVVVVVDEPKPAKGDEVAAGGAAGLPSEKGEGEASFFCSTRRRGASAMLLLPTLPKIGYSPPPPS